MDTFERFWREYPRRVAKKKAQKAWNALKPDEAMADRIMSVLNQRKAYEWVQPDLDQSGVRPKPLEFIPYPATFLRSEDFSVADVEMIEEPLPLFMSMKVKP